MNTSYNEIYNDLPVLVDFFIDYFNYDGDDIDMELSALTEYRYPLAVSISTSIINVLRFFSQQEHVAMIITQLKAFRRQAKRIITEDWDSELEALDALVLVINTFRLISDMEIPNEINEILTKYS
jgi:hypothetical protein